MPSPDTNQDPGRILIVFDVNIYLDAARVLGEPFSWEKLIAFAVEAAKSPVPHPSDPAFDSVRALVSVTPGVHPDGRRLEVWTSDHVDRLVGFKASQPNNRHLDNESRGLGWSVASAQDLLEDLVGDLVWDKTEGGTVGDVQISYGTPPLSHEDGCVYATVRDAGVEGQYYERFCITRDKEFLSSALPGDISVQHPATWLASIRRASRTRLMPVPRFAEDPEVSAVGM